MQSAGGIVVGGVLGLNIIKAILEFMLYITVIIASLKAIQALNVYIKNNKK